MSNETLHQKSEWSYKLIEKYCNLYVLCCILNVILKLPRDYMITYTTGSQIKYSDIIKNRSNGNKRTYLLLPYQ